MIKKMQEGASKEDIEQLTKFKFRKVGDANKHTGDEAQGTTEGIMTECGTDSPIEHTLLQEDAVSIHYNTPNPPPRRTNPNLDYYSS